MDLKGGAPHAVTPAGFHDNSGGGLVSPDGKSVLVTDDTKWWLFPIEGGEGRPALGLKPGEVVTGWGADGAFM